MQVTKYAFLTALLAGTSSLALGTGALADQQSKSDNVLGEITVTAEKRTENLQLTPISISAITADKVELQRIEDVRDISGLAPNVSVLPGTTNATAAIISIRGVPTAGDETQGFDSPVGLYLDGVFLARSSVAAFEVADIERVEVLRGPQGTLFGRNTTGGAVNFITKLPGDEQSLRMRLGYGNYNQFEARAVYNTGAMNNDKLRASIAFLHKQRNGTVDDVSQPSRRDPGSHNTNAGRLAITYDPTDSVKITNIFDYTRIDSVVPTPQLAAAGDGTFRPNVTVGGGTFAQVQPAPVLGYLNQSTITAGCVKAPSTTYLDTTCAGAGQSFDKVYGDLLRIEADLRDDLSVRSSTAWRGWRNRISFNNLSGLGTVTGAAFTNASLLNGMPAALLSFIPTIPAAAVPFVAASPVPTTTQPLFAAGNRRRQNQVSQEVELVSNNGGAFEWVLGGFYFHERGAEFNNQSFGFILDTNQIFLANFGALGPALAAANPARYRNFATPSTTLAYRAGGNSYAVYGQGTYRPGGKDSPLGITAGLRYTWDKKWVVRSQNGPTPFATATDIALNNQEKSFSAVTGNVTVDYRAADDINLYARVARGYRSGGFNLRQNTDSTANIPLIPFNDEHIMAYEVGAKTEFFGRVRLNVAGFYNVYTNQLSTIPIPGGATFGTQVVNAGKTNYAGVEAEGQFQVTDNFGLDGSFGYVHKDPANFPGVDITGTTRNIGSVITIGASPDYTANLGAMLTYPIGDSSKITARVGWSYVSSQVGFPNPLTAPFQQQTKFQSHGLWDAQVRLSDLKVGVGEGLNLTVWAKNLTNRHYVARSVDFGQLGFGTAIYGDPRTFGASLDIAF